MPDLWKALGDVYGEADARPVHVEPSAAERVPMAAPAPAPAAPAPAPAAPLPEDLAAALSAALVDGSGEAIAGPAPAAPAPPPVVETVEPGVPDGPAQERINAWLAE